MKLTEIAAKIGARVEGADVEIDSIAGIGEARSGQLTFVANPKYAPQAKSTKASAVIVDENFPALQKSTLRTKNPYFAFAQALKLFYQPPEYEPGIHPTAVVHSSAKIGKNASIGPYVVVGENVTLGNDCTLVAHVVIYRGVTIGSNFFAHAHAVVREFCKIGNNVILQNGVVVGADGFGFAKDDQGRWQKIVQSGHVVIGDNVEIQAHSCIDRAAVGVTQIDQGAKIDNFVQVGHGSSVGEDSLLCAQVGLAGSTEVGKNVILAGQVGVAGHCKVGDGAIMTAQSGVSQDVGAGKMVSGSPAFDNKQWLRAVAVFNKLPELAKRVRKLAGSDE
jgi:UDP-3-O-[3-hydroxymyristoyl] glucosamine N-acyltransferase